MRKVDALRNLQEVDSALDQVRARLARIAAQWGRREALDAVIAARDPLYYPEQRRDGLEAHRVREAWLFASDASDVWIDVTETIDAKLDALRAHASQTRDWPRVEQRVRERCQVTGSAYGVAYAETFKRLELPPG